MALETLPVLGYQIEDLGKVCFFSYNFATFGPQWVVLLSLQYSLVALVSGYPFWQLSIGHEMDVNQVVHCLGHLARNTQSLLENSQSQPAYYCRHTIKWHIGNFLGVRERNRRWGTACFSSPPFSVSLTPLHPREAECSGCTTVYMKEMIAGNFHDISS